MKFPTKSLNIFHHSLSMFSAVKEFWKSVKIWQNYC